MKTITRLLLTMAFGLFALTLLAATGPWDADVSDFPRQAGETGDSARIMRAVEAAGPHGVVWFPRGTYEVDEMLVVSNTASLWLHKSAELKAVKKIPYVLRYFGRQQEGGGAYSKDLVRDHGLFIKGGDFNGNGLASCIQVGGLWHFTMSEMAVRNGKEAGELIWRDNFLSHLWMKNEPTSTESLRRPARRHPSTRSGRRSSTGAERSSGIG